MRPWIFIHSLARPCFPLDSAGERPLAFVSDRLRADPPAQSNTESPDFFEIRKTLIFGNINLFIFDLPQNKRI